MTCEVCSGVEDITDLSLPYLGRICSGCGRQIKFRRLGKHGIGIKVEKGEQLVVPVGSLKIAANPLKGGGYLTRHGISWFANLVFVDDYEKHRENISEAIREETEEYENFLRSSSLLEGLNIDDETHADRIIELINKSEKGTEWWVVNALSFLTFAKELIDNDDAKKAAWAMGLAQKCRAMFLFKENFEEVVWMGHSAKRLVDVLRMWDGNQENDDEEFWQNCLSATLRSAG